MRFQTNSRLWLRISLVLFLISLCFPFIDVKSESKPPIVWLWEAVIAAFQGDFGEAFGLIVIVILWISFFIVASVVLAWPIQSVIVVVRTRKRKKIDHVA